VGIQSFFRYSPRRADCPAHGVLVEHAPWAQSKEHQAASYKVFLASWARRFELAGGGPDIQNQLEQRFTGR